MLAESELQLGEYRGHTFRWLLENDVGYACGLITAHESERENGNTLESSFMLTKDALVSYARPFPPMVAAINRRKMSEGSQPRGLDDTLVGFGAHGHMTYKSLYGARDKERRT